MQYIGEVIAFLLLCCACLSDIKYFIIPNRLSVMPYVVGVLLYLLELDFIGLAKASIAAVIIFIVLFLLYLTKGLGAGDVKFLTGLSFLLDYNRIWSILIYSFLIAGLIAIVVYVIKFILRRMSKLASVNVLPLIKFNTLSTASILNLHQIPFMIAVLPAFILDFYVEVLL